MCKEKAAPLHPRFCLFLYCATHFFTQPSFLLSFHLWHSLYCCFLFFTPAFHPFCYLSISGIPYTVAFYFSHRHFTHSVIFPSLAFSILLLSFFHTGISPILLSFHLWHSYTVTLCFFRKFHPSTAIMTAAMTPTTTRYCTIFPNPICMPN